MKKLISLGLIMLAVIFTGCTGIITKHEYSKNDFKIMYKVVKGGVPIFMTQEQIEKARLDKLDLVITDTYKIIEAEGKN